MIARRTLFQSLAVASVGLAAGAIPARAQTVEPSARALVDGMAQALSSARTMRFSLTTLMDGDTGWHVRVGDWIREHGTFPRQDFMSFSKAGEPWYAWEWGAEVLMSYVHGWAGLKGVVLALGMVIPAYLMVMFRHAMWRGATPLIALPLLLVASGSSACRHSRTHW